MRNAILALSIFLALAPALVADPGDACELPLHVAAARSEVKVRVLRTEGYAQAELELLNCAAGPRRVRLPGTYLRPSDPRYQRLSLSYARQSKSPTVTLDVGQRWSGWVASCCMDGGKDTPSGGASFRVVFEPAPDRITAIMEHWAFNPDVPQSEINGHVWGSASGPLPGNPVPEDRGNLYSTDGSRLLAWGDRLIVLTPEGALLRYRPEGKGAWDLLGRDARAAGYACGRLVARFGADQVREYNETERRWFPLGTLRGASEFFLGPGHAFARVEQVLYRHEGAHGWIPVRRAVARACLSLDPDRARVFAATLPAAGGAILCSSGGAATWKNSSARGFTDVVATENGLYGVGSAGVVAFTRDGYKILKSEAGRPLAFREGFYLQLADGRFLEYRERGGSWNSRGTPGSAHAAAADPVTGAVYVLKPGGAIAWLPRFGDWADLARLPEPEDFEEKAKPAGEGVETAAPETDGGAGGK